MPVPLRLWPSAFWQLVVHAVRHPNTDALIVVDDGAQETSQRLKECRKQIQQDRQKIQQDIHQIQRLQRPRHTVKVIDV